MFRSTTPRPVRYIPTTATTRSTGASTATITAATVAVTAAGAGADTGDGLGRCQGRCVTWHSPLGSEESPTQTGPRRCPLAGAGRPAFEPRACADHDRMIALAF